MRTYRIVVSFDVEAENEEHAAREAMNVVTDDSHVIESIVERQPKGESKCLASPSSC
jgi:hypothetical protein